MRFYRNAVPAAIAVAALLLAACGVGGEKTDVTQRAPKETEAGMSELIATMQGKEAEDPMEGDNQAVVEIGTAEELAQFRDRVNEGEAALDARQGSKIEDCYNEGTVTGAWDTGGVIGGASEQSVITGCYNTAAIAGKGRVAGIAAMAGQAVIDGCYNTGSVSGVNAVAGILAMTKGAEPDAKCVVANCFNQGEISAATAEPTV